MTVEEFDCQKAIATGALGFDFTHENALNLLDKWHEIAKRRVGFLSFVPDEASFSALVHKMDLMSCEGNPYYFQCYEKNITDDTVLFVDWLVVHK